MGRRSRAAPIVVLGAAVVAWSVCFRLLAAWGTWVPFAVAGVVLCGLSYWVDPRLGRLTKPSARALGVGALGGAGLVAGTYVSFAAATWLWPDLATQTQNLYGLLHASRASTGERAALIALVVASEEILFRGSLLDREGDRGGLGLLRARMPQLGAATAIYAAAMAASGSVLLVAVALVCGAWWAAIRVVSGSTLAAILAHLAWDLAILVLWPLV